MESLKLVSYYLTNPHQIFATFNYKGIDFDMVREKSSKNWEFLEDDAFICIASIINTEILFDNCLKDLCMIDSYYN